MKHRVTLIEGDGIGPEVTRSTCRVLEAAGVEIEWEPMPAGGAAVAQRLDPLPEATVESIRGTGVALKGPLQTPVGVGYRSPNVALRKALDLYANLRPVKSHPGVPTRFPPIDIVIVRENTEDLYSGIEHTVAPGVVESIKIITERASLRIARFAFRWAADQGRKRLTAIHKANIMKLSDGLFLDCVRRVRTEFPAIAYDELIVDNACMQLVTDPTRFDVLLLENLYGDILSDLVAGLVGGLGLVPGANLGDQQAVFEAVHGCAPDIAGRGVASPIAMILSGALLLDHLEERAAGRRVRGAVANVLEEGRVRTRDLGGTASTAEVTEAVIAKLRG